MSRDICLLTGIAPDGVQIRRVLWIYFTQTGWIITGFLMFIWERQIRIRWVMPEGPSESEAHWFLTRSSVALPISSRVQVSRTKSDSDSEKIQLQVSQNIAEQKLRALAEKRGGRNQAVGHPHPLQRQRDEVIRTVLLFHSQEHQRCPHAFTSSTFGTQATNHNTKAEIDSTESYPIPRYRSSSHAGLSFFSYSFDSLRRPTSEFSLARVCSADSSEPLSVFHLTFSLVGIRERLGQL